MNKMIFGLLAFVFSLNSGCATLVNLDKIQDHIINNCFVSVKNVALQSVGLKSRFEITAEIYNKSNYDIKVLNIFYRLYLSENNIGKGIYDETVAVKKNSRTEIIMPLEINNISAVFAMGNKNFNLKTDVSLTAPTILGDQIIKLNADILNLKIYK